MCSESQEQLEMLDKLIARWSGRGVGLQQRVAQLGTTLNFGTIGELCRVAEQLLLRMTHRQKGNHGNEIVLTSSGLSF